MMPLRPCLRLWPVLLLALVVSGSGCGSLLRDRTIRQLGRNGMQGAVAGMDDTKADLRRILREVLLDEETLQRIAERATSGVIVGMAEDANRARIAALVAALADELRGKGEEAVGIYLRNAGKQLEDSLDGVAARALRRADDTIKDLLHKDLLQASAALVEKNAQVLARSLAAELQGPLGDSLQAQSGKLAHSLVGETVSALSEERNKQMAREFMREAMRDAVLGMGDGIRQGLRNSSIEAGLIAGVIGLGTLLLLMGGCLWYFFRQYSMSTRALAVIAKKINDQPTPEAGATLKRAIQEGAEKNQVQPWLSSFLKSRGL